MKIERIPWEEETNDGSTSENQGHSDTEDGPMYLEPREEKSSMDRLIEGEANVTIEIAAFEFPLDDNEDPDKRPPTPYCFDMTRFEKVLATEFCDSFQTIKIYTKGAQKGMVELVRDNTWRLPGRVRVTDIKEFKSLFDERKIPMFVPNGNNSPKYSKCLQLVELETGIHQPQEM